MTQYALVYPMAAMVLLTVIVLGRMLKARIRAVREGEVDVAYYKVYQGEKGEPPEAAQHSRHIVNLFEAPTLFYVACLAAMVTQQTSQLIVALAWAYVAVRVVHTYIHIGKNSVRPRLRAYATSWLVLIALWVAIVYGVATA